MCKSCTVIQTIKELIKRSLKLIGGGRHEPAEFVRVKTVPLKKVLTRVTGEVSLIFSDIQGDEKYFASPNHNLLSGVLYLGIATHSLELHALLSETFQGAKWTLLEEVDWADGEWGDGFLLMKNGGHSERQSEQSV